MDIDLAKKKLKSYLNWEEIHGFSKGLNDLAIETILNELEKKDKIIDLMANQVLYDDMKTEANRFVTSEEIIEYFTNKVEESD